MDDHVVEEIVTRHQGSLGGMLSILSEVQDRYGHLSQDALRRVAAATGGSLTDIYGVATFYKAFTLKPRGKHLVSVCLGTACHVRGAPRIADELRRQLGIQSGETTADNEFTLETVNCLGGCALGPIVVVDGRYYSNVRKDKVAEILRRAREGLDEPREDRGFPLTILCPHCRQSLMDPAHPIDGVASVRLAIGSNGGGHALYLSCLHGSPGSSCDEDIPADAVMDLICPMCGRGLTGEWMCPDCGEAMAIMRVREGATLGVCKRRGCGARRLDLDRTGTEAAGGPSQE
ncbi:MAG TPA: NAD(P)H-dependent oxidoreductase subunit E [Phycisphaerales bacterium]|nr:NAD(P)H-dependent oxidoreductase subunit E [Phycisphaerales bacterium]